ncbi:unnamed protein product [Parnassius apollo]|nr:unnamed protein product [Parnassius apollo]
MKAARRPIAELTEKEKEKKRREWRLAKKKQKEGGVTKPKNNKCCALNARLCEKLKKRITDQKKVIDNILLKKHALQKNLYRHKIKIEELRKLISNSERTENKYLINSSESKTNSEFVPTDINAPTTSSGLTTTDKSENEDLREKTPMSKTLSFINENIPSISTPEKNKVKKQILQLNVISASLQTAYEKHDNKSKQILKDIVSSEAIEKYNLKTDISKSLGLKGRNQIPNDLDPVPLTTRLHQITYHVPSTTLRYRNVSCFCKSSLPRGICECYNAKTHVLKKTIVHKINCSTNVSKRMRNNEEAGQLNECGAVLPEIPVVSHRISTNDIDVIHDEGGIFQSKTKASSCIIRETAGTKIVLMAKNQNSLNINTNVLTNVKQKPKIISQVIIPPSKCTPKIVTNNENKENLSSLNTKNYDRLKRKTRKEIKRKDKKLKRKKEEDESSNSDIAMSVHSDSDICDVASESDSLDMQDTDFNINKSKSKGCKKNVKVKIEKTKTCLIPDTMLHQPSSSSNLEIVPIDIKKYDYVLVRHFLKKRVEYFVGTVLEKPFNDKVKISFLRKVGKHDNTKFIKTKSMEVELIDCKNIVKTVELMSINENETDFVFLDDDDYIYFD